MMIIKCLMVLGFVLTTAPMSKTIQWGPPSTKKNVCVENYLRLNCTCDVSNKVLNISSFDQQFDVHSNIHDIIIQNCQQVIIGRNSLNNLRSLRNLQIISIEDLILSDSALNWTGYKLHYDTDEQPSLNIVIKNSVIKRVANSAFKGAPSSIKFDNSVFESIEPFAFASLTRLIDIEINKCVFKKVQQQAFKGIQTRKFIINNSNFSIVPSSAFRDLDVSDNFKIFNSAFDILKSSAFIVKQPKTFEIINSKFNEIESESFLIRTTGNVIIKNNYFGKLHERSFMGINLIKENKYSANQELLFADNQLNDLKIGFNRSSYNLKYGNIFLNQSCNCVEIQTWIVNNEIKEYLHCVNDTLRQTSIQVEIYRKKICETATKTWVILVSVFSFILILLIVAVFAIIYFYRKYKKRKQKEYVNRGQTKKGSVGLIVPDGRTYRETEVHVIVEKAELLTTEL